jgi:hypothetical protein
MLLALAGCAGTRAAYDAASTPQQKAYVIAEHYSALVKQAADLKDAGTLTGVALEKVQAADRAAKPLVVELTKATEAYQGARNAQNEAELQAALNKAVIAVNSLINALRGVRT